MIKKTDYKNFEGGINITKDTITITNTQDISYKIILSDHIFSTNNKIVYEYCEGKRLLIFIDKNVYKLYGDIIKNYFQTLFSPKDYFIKVVSTSEKKKNLSTVQMMYKLARKNKIDRRGILIGIGGGILTDIVGFAAATYKRSIPYIKINTTLLGQVDVAVGIKTGVNFYDSKNLIGAFYPPLVAINDRSFLFTIDDREIRCGLAEIVKMGIICHRYLFDLVEKNYKTIIEKKFTDNQRETFLVLAFSMVKMVEELYSNLYEHHLERFVDFGHTFSPDIESESSFKIRHGEAVAIDIVISSRIAVILGYLPEEDYLRIVNLFVNIGLPIFDNKSCFFENMKKALENTYLHRGRKLNLVIPKKIGEATFIKELTEITDDVLIKTLSDLKAFNENLKKVKK